MGKQDSRLTADRARELFNYDPETGIVTRRVSLSSNARAGDTIDPATEGRISLYVDGVRYLLHRVIWLYVRGRWPEYVIDHRDGDDRNNRWVNLRDVPQRINLQNRRAPESGRKHQLPLGVQLDKRTTEDRFRAVIAKDRKRIYLGTFMTPELAHEAYLVAKRRLHEGCTI